jgi:hypothetical protein
MVDRIQSYDNILFHRGQLKFTGSHSLLSPPQFQVTPEDSPGTVFSAASASGVWKQLLDQIASLGVTAKTHASGPEMLGLSNFAVTKAIQVL